uniref:Putative secreted protein n=1 Tax=Anopheles darlingi TaxID=43151 RepID=A0A2M4DJ77_ANODA
MIGIIIILAALIIITPLQGGGRSSRSRSLSHIRRASALLSAVTGEGGEVEKERAGDPAQRTREEGAPGSGSNDLLS